MEGRIKVGSGRAGVGFRWQGLVRVRAAKVGAESVMAVVK